MKFQYYGTAAAEGIPALFCTCAYCNAARAHGGKDLRSRAQALVDQKILIDFNSDTLYHSFLYGLDLTKVHSCLITHVHEDHFIPFEISMLGKGYAQRPDDFEPFHLYGSEDIEAICGPRLAQLGDRLIYHKIRPYEPLEVEGFKVTALKAYHGTDHPYNYLLEKDGSALLYAHDSGLPLDETWEYLETARPHLTMVSLDCTGGAVESRPHGTHMCIGWNRIVKNRLLENGLADKNTKFFVNHFSHNGASILYDDMSRIAEKEGFLVSYDGLEVEF